MSRREEKRARKRGIINPRAISPSYLFANPRMDRRRRKRERIIIIEGSKKQMLCCINKNDWDTSGTYYYDFVRERSDICYMTNLRINPTPANINQ